MHCVPRGIFKPKSVTNLEGVGLRGLRFKVWDLKVQD